MSYDVGRLPGHVLWRLRNAYPKAVHLLTPRWRAENESAEEKSTGFCYIGAEAAYHALGGRERGWTPYVASYEDDGNPATHWWIERDGHVVDPTADQYYCDGVRPPYHLGRRTGFLTREPSKRATELLAIAGLSAAK